MVVLRHRLTAGPATQPGASAGRRACGHGSDRGALAAVEVRERLPQAFLAAGQPRAERSGACCATIARASWTCRCSFRIRGSSVRSVDLPEDSEIPEPALQRLRSVPPINIYRLLGIVPQAVVPWTDLTQAVYECTLEPRLREIAICRQAHAANAAYELHQHSFLARNNGVSGAELEAVLHEPAVGSLDPAANLVCRAADELEARAALSDDTFD